VASVTDGVRPLNADVMPLKPLRGAMNRLLWIMLGLLACSAVAADENDFRCLKSVGLKNPLRLQFTFPAGTADSGFVTYQSGSGRIPVRRIEEKELRRVPGGRPSAFQTRWEEVTPDGSGGTYVVVTQGALLEEFRYIRKKDGRIFKFEEDLDASTDKGCEWNTK